MLKQHALIIGLVIAVTIHAYDELVLAIAMPSITEELDGFEWYGLAFASYLLTTLIGVVWAGQDTDRRGPLRVFLVGYFAFGIGLLLAGFAQSMEALMLGRALQGLGGGISWTVAFATINLAYEPLQRPKMIAILDIAWVVPSLLAPIIGGYFVEYLDWRWIFLSQLPILIVASVLLYPQLKKLNKSVLVQTAEPPKRMHAAIYLAGLCALVLYISNQALSWHWLLLVAGVILMRKPFLLLMPQGFSKLSTTLALVLLIHGMVFVCFYGMEIFLPIATTDIHGMNAVDTGFLIGAGAITWCIASFSQAKISAHLETSTSLRIGFGLFLLGISLFIASNYFPNLNSQSAKEPAFITLITLYLAMAITSFGTGMAFNTCVSSAMSNTEQGSEGATSTSLGIISSLSIGLVAGIGGGVLNFGDRQGLEISFSLDIIWLITAVCAALVCTILTQRLKGFERAAKSSE